MTAAWEKCKLLHLTGLCVFRLFQHINPDMWERREAEESRSSHDPCIPPSSINTVRLRHSHQNLLNPTFKLPSLVCREGKLVLLHLSAGSSLPPLPSAHPSPSVYPVFSGSHSSHTHPLSGRDSEWETFHKFLSSILHVLTSFSDLLFWLSLPVFHILPLFPSHQRVMCALRCFITQGRSASPRSGCTHGTLHALAHRACAFNMFPCSFKTHLTVTRSSTFGSVGPMQGWIQAMTDYNPCSFVVWQKQEVK